MKKGFLALILHAHLPFVKHPEFDDALEEHWLFEAITETYIPLLTKLEMLVKEKVDFQLTLSLSPSLLTMFGDPMLQYRYTRRLNRLIDLSLKEVERTTYDPQLHKLAQINHQRLLETKEIYETKYQRNLVSPFKKLQDEGYVEILGSTATHGLLPLLQSDNLAIKTQIEVGINYYKEIFGRQPKGFWLPECGYYPGLGEILAENEVKYVFLETHGLTQAEPSPQFGVYEPIYDENGVFYFGRDPESSRQVWSSGHGYPGDFDYREFYRDIGFDLEYDYLKPCILSPSLRFDTGLKYYRITGEDNHKELYDPKKALEKVKLHAKDFIEKKHQQIKKLQDYKLDNPIIVAPFDAELFGHWWWEGIDWLEHVIRGLSEGDIGLQLTTIDNYISGQKQFTKAQPSSSSWGKNGYYQVWLNPDNDWIYKHLNSAIKSFIFLARETQNKSLLVERAFKQALRELLLAQSSDWAFMIGCKSCEEYGRSRVESHFDNFNKLIKEIRTDNIDVNNLTVLEFSHSLFPDIDYQNLIAN